MKALVFDVGGTQLRAAQYDGEAGRLTDVRFTSAPSAARYPHATWNELRRKLVDEMGALRNAIDPAGEARFVVVAFPGPIDGEGRALSAPTLWGSQGMFPYDLRGDLRSAWSDVDVQVLNDVSAAGYRYLRGPADEFCITTLSTGIGNKVFARGRPLVGSRGAGGEIGHLRIDMRDDAPPCDCGGRGHLGAFASGRGALARAAASAKEDPQSFLQSCLTTAMGMTASTLTAEALALAYLQEDRWASRIIARGSAALASVFASIHLAVGIERFVLVGGFAFGLGEPFRAELEAATNARCWRGDVAAVSVELGISDGLCALVGGGRAAEAATSSRRLAEPSKS